MVAPFAPYAASVAGNAARSAGGAITTGAKRVGNYLRNAWSSGSAATAKTFKDARDLSKKIVERIKGGNFDITRLKSASKRAGVNVKGKSKEALKASLIRKAKEHPLVATVIAFELFGPSSEFVLWAYDELDGAEEALERIESEKYMDGESEIPDSLAIDSADQSPAERYTEVVSGMEAKREVYETIGRVSAAIGGDNRLRELKYVLSLDLTTLDEYFELKSMRSVFR